MADIESRVLENSDKFSKSEKEIINYIFSNPEEVRKMSLAKLAKTLYVSESSIFRLCKKIGLSGYSELRFELANLSSDDFTAKEDIASTVEEGAQKTFKYFNTLDLNKFFAAIKNAKTIYLYSTGWAQELIAKYIEHELFVVGKRAVTLPSAVEELRIVNEEAEKGDMLFIISFSGDNIAVNEELKRVQLLNDNLVTVSLTTLKPAKLVSMVDYSFFFYALHFSDAGPIGKNAFSPAYTFIDLLIANYYQWLD